MSLGGDVEQVRIGASAACALLVNGQLRCWGDGGTGVNGVGSTRDIGDNELPTAVSTLTFPP